MDSVRCLVDVCAARRQPAAGRRAQAAVARAAAVLLAVALAAFAPGCAGPHAPAAHAPATPSTNSPATFSSMCVRDAGRIPAVTAAPDPGAPPYDAGDAPAPVYFADVNVSEDDQSEGAGDYIFAEDGALVTSSGSSGPASWSFSRASQAQLIACIYGNGTSSASPRATPCVYDFSTQVPVYEEKYTITLYIARTGQILTSRTITGIDANVCPGSVSVDVALGTVQDPPTLTTILTISDITSVIGKYASA